MKRISEIFSSFRLAIVLLTVLAVSLAAATWIENIYGTQVARNLVYHSPVLFILLALLTVNFFAYAVKHGLLTLRRVGLVLTHTALVVVMAGAAVTHFFGEEGIIHIREGERVDIPGIPFGLRLNDFNVERYPGSDTPSSYESFITVYEEEKEYDAHIYMNNVLDVGGYRLFQTSFDPDEKGTVLSYNHDAVGRMITYTGYILLFIGLFLSIITPQGRFRRLYRALALGFVLCPHMLSASSDGRTWDDMQHYMVDESHAERFGHLPVQSLDGRIMPVNTFSSEIFRKLYKSDKADDLNPDRFLLSLIVMPDIWAGYPCIYVGDASVASQYGLNVPHTSYATFFDANGKYILQDKVDSVYRTDPSHRSQTDKDILKLDERVNVFNLIAGRRLLNLFPLPDDPSGTWYAPGDDLSCFEGKDSMFVSRIFDWYVDELSVATYTGSWDKADEVLGMISTYQKAKASGVTISEKKLKAEVLYNSLDIFHYCMLGYLIFSAVLLLVSIGISVRQWRIDWLKNLLLASIIFVFIFHTAGIAVRWYIAGYAPWTNSYETMIYVAWASVLAGLIFSRRNLVVLSLAVLFGGIILSVSGMNWMDPQITTLVPVLKSPWLMFHVAVIVASYGFLGLSCMIGIVNMSFMMFLNRASNQIESRIRELGILNELSLWVGLVLLTMGSFLGAVWANESWGRYWGWDPKETWALITIIVYVLVTHIHLLDVRLKEWLFNFMSVIAFSSVLMTFLGVNHFFSGMHSYGHNEHFSSGFTVILAVFAIIILLGIISYREFSIYHKRKRSNP